MRSDDLVERAVASRLHLYGNVLDLEAVSHYGDIRLHIDSCRCPLWQIGISFSIISSCGKKSSSPRVKREIHKLGLNTVMLS